ncbi:MAG: hypothetical protein V5A76_08075 [Candidatus Thermoplasmatota archaeon]
MFNIDKTAVLIGVIFGIVTILALIYLQVQAAFMVVMLWLIIPVIIKRLIEFFKKIF